MKSEFCQSEKKCYSETIMEPHNFHRALFLGKNNTVE